MSKAVCFSVITILISTLAIVMYNIGFTNIHVHKIPLKEKIKVACIGDSITYGCGVWGWARNNYPKVLGTLLGEKYHVENFGVSGRTAVPDGDYPFIREKQYQLSMEYNPNIVVIMFGTNDSKPQNWKGADIFKDLYQQFILTYQKIPSVQEVYVCSPTQAYYTGEKVEGNYKFDIREKELKEISTIVKVLAAEMKLHFIDINTVTKRHSEWFEFDGIHPNKDGANAIAKEVCRCIEVCSCINED